MSFYLRPPKGMTNLHKLEETVMQRLKCYEHLDLQNAVEIISQMECLMEDCVMDRLGHYLFRLAALKNSNFHNIFPQNETKLLDIRLSCYQTSDIRTFLKKVQRQSKISLQTIKTDNDNKITEFLNVLLQVCDQMLKRNYFDCMQEQESCLKCDSFVIKDLLSARTVLITKGFLQIYPYQWKNLILSLYHCYLLLVLKEMKTMPSVRQALDDERISEVVKMTSKLYFKNIPAVEKGTFDLENIENEAKLFPLCMSHLYRILKKTNRLAHNDRFDFSLFLKSIGMSMSDSLQFWQAAYSKSHASCSKCTHTWQESEKRYIYGIRHMYGLEGGRKNYSCKSCHQIENTLLGANQDGGCPFKHFDDKSLTDALKSQLSYSSKEIEVIIHERKTNSRKACSVHMENKLKAMTNRTHSGAIGYLSPSDYYLLVKGLSKNTSSSDLEQAGTSSREVNKKKEAQAVGEEKSFLGFLLIRNRSSYNNLSL